MRNKVYKNDFDIFILSFEKKTCLGLSRIIFYCGTVTLFIHVMPSFLFSKDSLSDLEVETFYNLEMLVDLWIHLKAKKEVILFLKLQEWM